MDRELVDRELIDLGKRFQLRVVHAPAHAQGSVCFHWETGALVFSGDSMMGLGARPDGLPLVSFPADYERTLARILELDGGTLALGHNYRDLALPSDLIHFGSNVKVFLTAGRWLAYIIGDALCRSPWATLPATSWRWPEPRPT